VRAAVGVSSAGVDRTRSQTVRAQLALRDLILQGALRPGERVSELGVAERLGASRSPVRTALVRLEEEGLLEAIPSGGFAVRAFSERDVFVAIEMRGTLEGLAARLAAERGVGGAALRAARQCLDAIDGVLRGGARAVNLESYVAANRRFHVILAEMADSQALSRQIDRACSLPFASPSAFVLAQSHRPESREILAIAQDQHRCVLSAIEHREGARAEALMREHARIAHRNLEFALGKHGRLDLVPGAPLIVRKPNSAASG
jgi:GntR family transcriptional regulator of vanillate catabolism